jgi:hypothetical protein
MLRTPAAALNSSGEMLTGKGGALTAAWTAMRQRPGGWLKRVPNALVCMILSLATSQAIA